MSKKKIISIVWNISLFIILLYFSNFNQLKETFFKINLIYLILGAILSITFVLITALRWEDLLSKLNTSFQRNKKLFIIASHKKEFFSSFTSNLVGDIYAIFKIKGATKVDLTYSLLITKYFDFFIVSVIAIASLILLRFLNKLYGILIILLLLIFLIKIEYFLKWLIGIINKISWDKLRLFNDLRILRNQEVTKAIIIRLLTFTVFLWLIRLSVTFFTFKSLNYLTSISQLLFITFIPIIASLVAFILPKSVSGDSMTVILGVVVGINYNILIIYVLIHRIYSLIISGVGIILDLFINQRSVK